MTFLWPSMLLLLVLVPMIILFYWRVQRRRQTALAGLSALGGGKSARKRVPGFRRHIPAALFLLGLVILVAALARPQAEVELPRLEGTVILVFDVSGSMAATDTPPTRIEAAKATAKEFVLSQPATVQIGIVSFSGSGFTVQAPTDDAQDLLAAINRLQPTSGTSLGQGILVALNTIAMDAGLDPVGQASEEAAEPAPDPDQQPPRGNELLMQLPEGPYPNSVIVLLSDGENNESIDPLEAAQAAADRAVRIDAIGFGTAAGATLEVDGYKVHTALDENMLQQITGTAGGAYFNAQNEQDPQAVYASLAPQLVVKPVSMEITSIFAGASLLIVILGAVLSLVWFTRLP
jgi:Ca-activated chloride channel family protein